MTEADLARALKRKLTEELTGAVIIKHWDRLTAVPDLSVTWNNTTRWLELKKVVNGKLIDREIQRRTLMKMWEAGHNVFYVLYTELNGDPDSRRTFITTPPNLDHYVTECERWSQGYDHGLVTDFLRRA